MKYNYTRGFFTVNSENELPEDHALFSLLDASRGDDDILSLNDDVNCEVFTAIMSIVTDSRVYLNVSSYTGIRRILTFTWDICFGSNEAISSNIRVVRIITVTEELQNRINHCIRKFFKGEYDDLVHLNFGEEECAFCVNEIALKIRSDYVKINKGLRVDEKTKRPMINSLGENNHETLLFFMRTDRMTKTPFWWRVWNSITRGRLAFVKLPKKYSTRSADLSDMCIIIQELLNAIRPGSVCN